VTWFINDDLHCLGLLRYSLLFRYLGNISAADLTKLSDFDIFTPACVTSVVLLMLGSSAVFSPIFNPLVHLYIFYTFHFKTFALVNMSLVDSVSLSIVQPVLIFLDMS
jgi:hypothetical protein